MPASPDQAARVHRWKRPVIRAAVLVTFAYICWCGALWWVQERLIFPREIIPAHSAAQIPGAIELRASHAWGSTPAILLLPARRDPGQRFPLVVWCHGNAETIDQDANLDEVRLYLQRRVAVLLPEYRGYGRAQGSPSQGAILEDLVSLYDQAVARGDIDPGRVAFFGRSLGGGVAAQLAALRPPRALMLQSTFTSIASFATGYGVPGFIVRSPFRTDALLPTFTMPMLIMHGDRDRIVPVSRGRRLKELAPSATYFEQAADHLDFPSDFEDYQRRIFDFLDASGMTRG